MCCVCVCERWYPLGQRRGIVEEIATQAALTRSSQRRTRTLKRRTCRLRADYVQMEVWWACSGGFWSTTRSRRRSLRGGCLGRPDSCQSNCADKGRAKSEDMSWEGSEGENGERWDARWKGWRDSDGDGEGDSVLDGDRLPTWIDRKSVV